MNKRGLEAKENWIAARVEELIVDNDFLDKWELSGQVSINNYAKQIAEREHASLMADLEEAIIDSMELK